jgi:two-component system sensor histidine kinase KdpD
MKVATRAAGMEAVVGGHIVSAAVISLSLILATLAAGALEQWFGIADASPVYLVPVVIAAAQSGTWAAVATSLAGFLVYDFLFTTPRFTLTVSDPAEWLSLLLFLIVAVVIGQLTALLRDRAEEADRRAREGVALVAMSRDVAMTATFDEAAVEIARRLLVDAEMASVWVTRTEAPEVAVAAAGKDVAIGPDPPWTLVRAAGDGGSDWLRLHDADSVVEAADGTFDHYVVAIEVDRDPVGLIHAVRYAGDPRPGRGARRLLALAADQLGVAMRRERLGAELTEAEVGRQSDALRAAILDSVSHDLRTPIASIRALAGGLADGAATLDGPMVREMAGAIDAEGARLGDLVNGLLDMGRIQAGALHPDLEPYDLADLVETTLRNHPGDRSGHAVETDIADELAPVLADAVLLDVALGNVLDNAAEHTPAGTRILVRARTVGAGWIGLEVDDAGGGVPADALPHLFDRFYRVEVGQQGARRGMGMGLAIARGFVEAMGGAIAAEASPLGGLGIRIRLRAVSAERP